jgi:hypothetical protein
VPETETLQPVVGAVNAPTVRPELDKLSVPVMVERQLWKVAIPETMLAIPMLKLVEVIARTGLTVNVPGFTPGVPETLELPATLEA